MTSPAHSALTSSLVASASACADRICDVWMDDGGACPPKASVKQTFGPLSACRHTQPSITPEMHRRCSVVGPTCTVGQRATQRLWYSTTRATCVCCDITCRASPRVEKGRL
jgi:hypothetical protein